ncbi:MAG TPA: hydrolase [Candidatus Latescibacteria bacterium]|nr:hydrolase [Candidatus Latescibacterota bacterium]
MKFDPEVIDSDVHNELPSLDALLPYLDEHWHVYLAESAFVGPGANDYPEAIVIRAHEGAIPKSGPAGSNIQLLSTHVFDEGGADNAILTCGFRAGSVHNQDFAADLSSAVNDWQIEHWLDKEPRFRASIVVPNQNPVRAAEEIERVGDHSGFVQVMLPVRGDAPYGNLRYDPIFESATRKDLVVGIHFGGAPGLPPTPAGWPSTYVEEYVDQAAIFQSQVLSLIFEGVFDRFPETRIALIESGWTWMPSAMWRFDKEWKGLRRDTPWVKRRPSDYIRDHIRLTTQPTDAPRQNENEQLTAIIDQLGSDDILMYASDYPHNHGVRADAFLSAIGSETTKQKILQDNAAAFYRI